MIGINWHRTVAGRLLALFAAAILILGLASCGAGHPELPKPGNKNGSATAPVNRISEVSPPEAIQKLRQALEIYQPQVSILNPKPDEVLQDINVSVQFQVKDLPIFKDANLGLGPHLQVLLDNQPYAAVYDINQPLTLSDLEPGTHTLRVFAARPWEESFKNEGAAAQTTFHVFTKTDDNNPDRTLPLLTYNSPQGSYGAQPILLDFYLTNAPPHEVAQENSQDEILDWKIRATVNGESFAIDQWQPIYLKGFKPGKNWVQLELIDERGNIVKNAFNNTVRLINFQPLGQDTLSKLVRGELTVAETRGIVDRTYQAPEPTPTPTPEPTPTPALEKTPVVPPSPAVPETPVTLPSLEPTVAPEVAPTQVIEPTPTATPQLEAPKIVEPVQAVEPTPTATPQLEAPKIVEPVQVIEPTPTATPQLETPKVVAPVKIIEPTPTASPEAKKQEYKGYYNRFRNFLRQVAEPANPSESPTLPEITEKAPVPKVIAPANPAEPSPNLVPPTPPVATETPSQPTSELAPPETTVSEPENQPKSEQKVEFAT
ncbi:hypothetical protein Osc7112_2069 [Oscillatoria nigro-viridis PCC 7112]|uniref:FHA domain containing protein n=1 Tax=Phormidium nigroviride PCC 7112 TaxID=179408 RepID=K9VGB5_9CYAN|nr:hypothetical protein [Oscillatoria nigro-viridis]AFZ06539.1 hypothetical protein Osc7112_2069 [Oscillatoria nigro-viridis PCC 7112]